MFSYPGKSDYRKVGIRQKSYKKGINSIQVLVYKCDGLSSWHEFRLPMQFSEMVSGETEDCIGSNQIKKVEGRDDGEK